MNELTAALKEELNVDTAFTLPIFGGIDIPESIAVSWGIMAFLVIGSILLTRNLRVDHITKRQAILETVVTTINDFFVGLLGESGKRYVPYLMSVALYIGCSNLIGVFGIKPPTKDLDVTAALAQALDVSPKALDVPDIDSYVGLMHTLFTLEDRYGLEVCECEDEVHLRVHIHKGRDAAELHRMLSAWGAVAAKLKAGEITKEEYDRWRYRYPELDTSGQWHKITPSQELSDMLLADLKEHTGK